MTNPADSSVQNLLPVQAYFNTDGSFNTFIGQGVPFYATANPSQSGLTITNSTLNSSPIGNTAPSTGVFTNIATTTGTVSTQPVGATDIVNLLALQSYAAGISWKQPCAVATLANITLSGLQTIDGYTTLAGDRVLVKNQSNAANNGIYLASASTWTRSLDANSWDELISAISFIEYGTQAGGAWFCTATPGGTLGVTAVNWSQFTTSATYSAGTGLTLTGTVFSITPVGTASTYGSGSTVPVFTTNASGQVSTVTNTNIAIGATQITSGTIDSARLSGSYSGITGLGTLTDLTVTNVISGSINGNAATATTAGSATTATTATNIAGGASGSIPYQTASGATSLLAKGTDGQILALASGLPSWINNQTGTVTSVGGTGTVSGISLSGTVTSSGSLTLGGTLDLSAPPAIGGTTPNSGAFTTVTASTSLTTPIVQATNSAGLALKNSAGTTQMSMGAGGGDNLAINVSANLNGANAQIDISPTGTGHVHLNPAGTGSVEIKPTNAGVMDNMVIGGTTPLAGTFTTLRVNSTISLAGSTGTSGYVMTSNGASAPTWSALPAGSITVTDDTTTNATRYLAFTSATSGSITGQNVSSTKLQYNPSTGILTSTGLAGALNGTVGATTPTTGAFTTASLKGSTSGVITLNTPAVAGTNTATFPAATGTVMVSGNIPAFGARPATSTQSVSNNTWTKVTLGTEEFDTNSNFASSTFTPTVAGYYQLNGFLFCTNSGGVMTTIRCNIYKNGSDAIWGGFIAPVAATDAIASVAGIVYLNGTTDYVELYGYIGGSSTSPVFAGATNYTQFNGCLVRAA
jgi:hypothetical protein